MRAAQTVCTTAPMPQPEMLQGALGAETQAPEVSSRERTRAVWGQPERLRSTVPPAGERGVLRVGGVGRARRGKRGEGLAPQGKQGAIAGEGRGGGAGAAGNALRRRTGSQRAGHLWARLQVARSRLARAQNLGFLSRPGVARPL